MHFCANQSYVLGQKNRGKPLRLVHRKVLRNWQVNCAMHAWAMQPGERSTQDLTIKTFYRHLHIIWLDVNFITGIKKDDVRKLRNEKAIKAFFDPRQIRQWLPLTLTYLVVLDPFLCRINLREDKPFLFRKSSPGCCCCCCLCGW